MGFNQVEIDLTQPIETWNEIFWKSNKNDFIVFNHNQDAIRLFISQYTQFLIRQGNNEVIPLYGGLIQDYTSFVYQANWCLPTSYKLGNDPHALYDLLLNFETEPSKRILIWNDADHLFSKDEKLFSDIFKSMIVSACVNRNGVSTIKESGQRYVVDQRNVFVFSYFELDDILHMLSKEYYIPSIDEPELYKMLDFNVVKLLE